MADAVRISDGGRIPEPAVVMGVIGNLQDQFCAAIDARVVIAGSISSYERIDTMFAIAPWGFTMGSALFSKNFVPDGSFRENLQAVADYMAKK